MQEHLTTNSTDDNTFPQHLVENSLGVKPPAVSRRGQHPKQLIPVPPLQLEELAFEFGDDKRQIAARLGCARVTLDLKMRRSDALRAAYERGLTRKGVPVKAPRNASATAAAAAAVSPAPQTTALRDATDDDLLLDAIRHGQRTVGDILRFTNLTNARLRRSLDVLEHTMQIKSRYERNLQHFYLSSEGWGQS